MSLQALPWELSLVTKAGSAGDSGRRCRLATRTARRIQLIWLCPGRRLPAGSQQTPRDRCLITSTYFHFGEPHVLGEFPANPKVWAGRTRFLPSFLSSLSLSLFLSPITLYSKGKNLQTSLEIPGSAVSQKFEVNQFTFLNHTL